MKTRQYRSKNGWLYIQINGAIYTWMIEIGRFSAAVEHRRANRGRRIVKENEKNV